MIGVCSMQRLKNALTGELSAAEEHELHSHLNECDACTAELERLAGGEQWSQEAREILTQSSAADEPFVRDEWSPVDFTVEHLEPVDDPNVLGRMGGYDVLEIIGRGGMGVVLKGFDPELKRYVAIKVLAPHLANSSVARKRFTREAQAAAAVVHPHVLAIHHVQPNGRLPYLVMPLVAGESLAQRLAIRGTLELKEILRIGLQAAAGLGAAHEQGLVHRDVKPANILLEKGIERAVLTDFGLARAADDVSLTRWGIIAGTPQYMSPEQARGEPLDGRSDLFSLGCVLYEMASGISPFRADSTLATMRRLVDEPPPALDSLNPELPRWFIEIVERLLQKSPADRYATAHELSGLLEACLAHVQQPANVPLPQSLRNLPRRVPPVAGGLRPPRRSGWHIALLALAMFLGGGGLLWGLFGGSRKTPEEQLAAHRSVATENVQKITRALQAYVEQYGHFPAAVVHGKDGTGGQPHSWRVEILPQLGEQLLYDDYHFDEAWDSPHNTQLLRRMPAVFRASQDDPRSTNTSYFGVWLAERPIPPGATPLDGPESAGPTERPAAEGASGPDVSGRPAPGAGPPSFGGPSIPTKPAENTAPENDPAIYLDRLNLEARQKAAEQWRAWFPGEKERLVRRIMLDLVGRVPTEEEMQAYLADDQPQALSRLIEKNYTNLALTRGVIANGVFVPEGQTVFSRPAGARPVEMTDGTSNTIAFVEAKRSIPWTKPEDITYNPTGPADQLGGWFADGWYAGYADGNTNFVPINTPADTVLALLTMNGGEPVPKLTPWVVLNEVRVTSVTNSQGFPDLYLSTESQNATQWRQRFGEQFEVVITGQNRGSVWGTDIYTDDSNIATAAVHAGLVKVGEQATVVVTIVKSPSKHVGLTRNGVTTADWGEYPSSYVLQRKSDLAVNPVQPEDLPALEAGTNASQWEGRFGDQFDVVVVGNTHHSVWGTGVFTTDSAIDTAAVHAGLLQPGERGLLTVTIVKSPARHVGTSRNGVNSHDWSSFPSSYVLQLVSKEAVAPKSQTTAPPPEKVLNKIGSRTGGYGLGIRPPLGGVLADWQTAMNWRGRLGEQFEVEVVGRTNGPVWGTDIYTDDSDIATAAVHAGLVKLGERATVLVTIVKPPEQFTAAERHGVLSYDYKAWEGAYVLKRVSHPTGSRILIPKMGEQGQLSEEFIRRARALDNLRRKYPELLQTSQQLLEECSTPEQVARVHAELAHVFAQSDIRENAIPVAENAELALQAEGDPQLRSRCYVYLGDALSLDPRLLTFSERRRRAAEVYLKGYYELQSLKLPEPLEELPPGPAISNDPNDSGIAENQAYQKRRQEHQYLADLLFQRNVLVGQVAQLYRREPEAHAELPNLTQQILQDDAEVNLFLKRVQDWQIPGLQPSPPPAVSSKPTEPADTPATVEVGTESPPR